MGVTSVRVVMTDCRPWLSEAAVEQALAHLDEARRGQVRRMTAPQARAQKTAAGLLLTYLFGENGRAPAVAHGAHGKPFLPGRDIHFSLSHTENAVFCAFSERPVGMDAQRRTPCRERVAERCFTERERAWMAAEPEERFTRLWAMKEAYLKRGGFGLSLPMRGVSVPLAASGALYCGPGEEKGLFWQELAVDELFLAICGEEPFSLQRVETVLAEALTDFGEI